MVELNDLRGIHAGKLAFVAGAGQSLRHVDVDAVCRHIVLTVNAAALKLPAARYWTTSDAGEWQEGVADWVRDNTSARFVIHRTSEVCDLAEHGWCDPDRLVYYRKNPKLSTFGDGSDGVIWGQSSAQPAVHAALIMGCRPVVLIGCDLRYDGWRAYFYQYDDQPGLPWMMQTRVPAAEARWLDEDMVPSHFWRHGTADDARARGTISSWENAWHNLAQANPTASVIDASGGNTGFPAMDLADVLREYG